MSKRRTKARRHKARPESHAKPHANGVATVEIEPQLEDHDHQVVRPLVRPRVELHDELPVAPMVARKYLMASRVLLLVLLFIGLSWRFVGLNWDDGHHLHPDERFLTMVVPELKLPTSLSQWFATSRSTFNPWVINPDTGLFVYGQLPLLLSKLVATPFGMDTYDGILIVGRALSALFDAATVLLIWLIARRLMGADGGLFAAVLLAFTALHIQLAHFYAVDTFASTFLVLCFWALLKWLASGRERWALIAGGAWGLSAACKVSTLLFAPIILLALLLPLWPHFRNRLSKRDAQRNEQRDAQLEPAPISTHIKMSMKGSDVLFGALALFLAAFVCFRIAHPIAFRGEAAPQLLGGFFDFRPAVNAPGVPATDAKNFWASIGEQREITIGLRDVPWNLQWFGRTNIVWPMRNLLVWGMGWQAMIPALAALIWLPFRIAKKREDAVWLLVVAWAILGFASNAMQYSKFSRYLLVVTPFFALLATWAARRMWFEVEEARHKYLGQSGNSHNEHHGHKYLHPKYLERLPLGAALLSGVILGGTVCWGSAVASIYRVPHTRVRASEFLHTLPEKTRLANESQWDDALPLRGGERLEMLNLKLIEPDEAPHRDHILDTLDKAQWLAVSSSRMWGSLPRLPMRYPLTSRYYNALFSGRLGWTPTHEWTSYPQLNLLGWKIDFQDDNTEEALSVYDHPRVVLFQKTPAWSRENAASILGADLLQKRDGAPLNELREKGESVDENALPWLPHPPVQ